MEYVLNFAPEIRVGSLKVRRLDDQPAHARNIASENSDYPINLI